MSLSSVAILYLTLNIYIGEQCAPCPSGPLIAAIILAVLLAVTLTALVIIAIAFYVWHHSSTNKIHVIPVGSFKQ